MFQSGSLFHEHLDPKWLTFILAFTPDQLNLFNEAEVEAKPSAPEPEIEVPAHKRRKKQKRDWVELLEKFPHEEKLYTLHLPGIFPVPGMPEAGTFCG